MTENKNRFIKLTELIDDPELINQIDSEIKELYEYWVNVLSVIYNQADWGKIAKSKNVYVHDVFQHKLRRCASKETVIRAVDKLRLSLSIQGVNPTVLEWILFLNSKNDKSLDILRKESSFIVMLVSECAKLRRMKEKNK